VQICVGILLGGVNVGHMEWPGWMVVGVVGIPENNSGLH
jgi:hypothetical protein